MVFRTLFLLGCTAVLGIRVFAQSRVLRGSRPLEVKESSSSLVMGTLAALTSVVFGAEYVLSPGFFQFAYVVRYPDWARWIGGLLLAAGVGLLGFAHHHLGRSFHSLVVSKQNQILVDTGPYRRMRHPIYTAYLLNHLGGGLLAGNLVLTLIPVTAYAMLVAIRMDTEEDVMRQTFGPAYVEYEKRTGRLFPRVRRRD
jgi:protein-S-isoprenylcysteine O-methyltransferase Ste14